MNVGTIKDEIAARLALAISGMPVRAYGWVTDKPEVPSGGVALLVQGPDFGDLTYNDAFAKGLTTTKFTVLALAADTSDGRGEKLLDQLMSAGSLNGVSLIDALESVEFTNSPPWNDCKVTDVGHRGRVESPDANTSYVRADFVIEVRKSRV